MKPNKKKRKATDGPPVQGGSNKARKTAAVILEVLGGVLRPSEAATALEISLPRYYQVELKALEGLVKACEPALKGPPVNPAKDIERLEQRIQRLQNECMRYQSLVRAAGKTVGLVLPKPKAYEKGKRKPTVRALKVVKALAPSAGTLASPTKVVK